MRNIFYVLSALVLFGKASAETKYNLSPMDGDRANSPLSEEESTRVPGDAVLPPQNKNIDQIVEEAQKAWEEAQRISRKKAEEDLKKIEIKKKVVVAKKREPLPKKVRKNKPKPRIKKNISFVRAGGESVTIFSNNIKRREESFVTLPSSSSAFGTILFGEEVTQNSEEEVVARLDYYFIGPNKSVLEMKDCRVWLKVHSFYSGQKVKGRLTDMTCRADDGEVFTVPVDGLLVSTASNYAGVKSDLNLGGPMKQAIFKFLSEITDAYGSAMKVVESTSQVSSNRNSQEKVTNVTGSKKQYIEGAVIAENAKFLEYVGSFFKGMQPTLAIAPGTKIHLVIRHNVKIPKKFFKGES